MNSRVLRGQHQTQLWMFALFAALVFFAGIDPVHAADATPGGGSGLPWETPLDTLQRSITGPVAFIISLLGIVACGAMLIWGGEISEFTRRIIYVVLVGAILMFANTLLTGALFSGAVIPDGLSLALEVHAK
ncbi:TrbC/VirB2 family protein [Shinella yambaruensis]|uniref:Conjugal transfer protein TrbC n=1 Tax=Shinella yambaruensis TaxID=415996 RepID=A0ABQ5ZX82_9HYPH|nr:TrbC/VirB2 family protein [Shinella yambaruensis]MCJ8029967.1 TrbC/VirB2 family protein [Shinella yambaruensis]MCU7984235.1 TrbC/VirB2 family protein [Shinella yambaruensis]GLR55218.1 hypothetical protein GCM10007923_64400 [Shinella yambaruensis]